VKNFIKSLVFMSVTSSLPLSSIAWGASARPTVNAADTKEASATKRNIKKLNGLSQEQDIQAVNRCGYYTAFSIIKMMRAIGAAKKGESHPVDYYSKDWENLLNNREDFECFFEQNDKNKSSDNDNKEIDDKEMLDILHAAMGSGPCSNNVICIGDRQCDNSLKFSPAIAKKLDALDCKQPIGIAMNATQYFPHWIAGVINIKGDKIALFVVDPSDHGHDCCELKIVKAVYDFFLKKAQDMSRVAADDSKTAASSSSGSTSSSISSSSSLQAPAAASAATPAADTKASATVRRIIQHPGLLQYGDIENNLSGFYTAFFITEMIKAVNLGNYDSLAESDNFNKFRKGQTLQPNIKIKEIRAILGKNRVTNACSVTMDQHGKFYPSVLQDLTELELNKPIGLAINLNKRWIAGMVTIDGTDVVLRVVDSRGDTCDNLPIVTAIYDYFVHQAQVQRANDIKPATAEIRNAATVNLALDAEAKNAREKLLQQQEEKKHADEKKANCNAYAALNAQVDRLPQPSNPAIPAVAGKNKSTSATASSSSTTTNLSATASSSSGSTSSSISSSSSLQAPAAASAAIPAVAEKMVMLENWQGPVCAFKNGTQNAVCDMCHTSPTKPGTDASTASAAEEKKESKEERKLNEQVTSTSVSTSSSTASSTTSSAEVAGKDEDVALKLYGKVDNAMAMLKLAICRQMGLGCAINTAEAHERIIQAVKRYPNYAPAQNYLGIMFLRGECGFKADEKAAVEQFSSTADTGDLAGMLFLNHCCPKELVIAKDGQTVAKLFKHVANIIEKMGELVWYLKPKREICGELKLWCERKERKEALGQAKALASQQTQQLQSRDSKIAKLTMQLEKQELESQRLIVQHRAKAFEEQRQNSHIAQLEQKVSFLQWELTRIQVASMEHIASMEHKKSVAETESAKWNAERMAKLYEITTLKEKVKQLAEEKEELKQKLASEIKLQVEGEKPEVEGAGPEGAERKVQNDAQQKDALLCKICFARPVDRFLPCGHLICDQCMNGLPRRPLETNPRCPHCRVLFDPAQVQRVFP